MLPGYGNLVLLLSAVGLTILTTTVATASAPSNHFGDSINWVTLEEGLLLSQATGKPLMLIIHKSWCGACKALAPKFSASAAISSLSTSFVMVNTLDDEEPDGEVYKPDGGYIPRILFFDPDHQLMEHIINQGGNPSYKYYYSSPEAIAEAMERVLGRVGSPTQGTKPNEEL